MSEKTLPLGIPYLGFLSGRLGDLTGYDIMANELIQNADDAKDATTITFDITDKALIVENDGVFTDCGQQESRECIWLSDPTIGHRCDFHRFRQTSSHDKSKEEDVTGAFGIGFISVYQITDYPELISSGRHWQVRPELPENQIIKVLDEDYPLNFSGTRFILPWALNPDSILRTQPGFEAVTRSKIEDLKETLRSKLSSAMIFLKKITKIELRVDSQPILILERIKEENKVFICDQDGDGNIWHIYEGDFKEIGEELKRINGSNKIHPNRSTRVMVAIPHERNNLKGLYHATLPTQETVGLPIHINSSFFPSSDRKRLLLDDGYKALWNRAAIECAAITLAENLHRLQSCLDFRDIWAILSEASDIFDPKVSEDSLKALTTNIFWKKIDNVIKNLNLLYTSRGEWKSVEEAFLLRDKKSELPVLPILEQMDIPIVHPDLTGFFRVLSRIGVPLFDLFTFVNQFESLNLFDAISLEKAPEWLKPRQSRQLLGVEIKILMNRINLQDQEKADALVKQCALVVSIDNKVCPAKAIRKAKKDVIELFGMLQNLEIFAGSDNPDEILRLVKEFSFEDVLRLLEEAPIDLCESIWQKTPSYWIRMIKWLDDRRVELKDNQELKVRLWNLTIWPSGKNLFPLNEVVVPGDFEDPLELTSVVDSTFLKDLRRFLLEDLEVSPLTIDTYTIIWIPKAFESSESISDDKKMRLINVLASEMGKFNDPFSVKAALVGCDLVYCRDRKFYKAARVYFRNLDVLDILGDQVPIAELPEKNQERVKNFWLWLGVAEQPRSGDIIARIIEIIKAPPNSKEIRIKIQRILINLGKRWPRSDQPSFLINPAEYSLLRSIAWLPAEDNYSEWFFPSKLFVSYNKAAFESQAQFLDIDQQNQKSSNDFMDFLGINSKPSIQQVVNHLLWCMENKKPANRSIYTYLNNFADAREVKALQGKACLYLKTDDFEGYVSSEKVFWGNHPFGKFRHQLGEGHENFQRFYKENGVRESPDYRDAIAVLWEISEGYDKTLKPPIDEDTYKVVFQCWSMMQEAYLKGILLEDELEKKLTGYWIIPNQLRQLKPVSYVLFEDRPRLAEKYKEFLADKVILKIQGIWEVMKAAGVENLSNKIHIESIYFTDQALSELLKRFRERRELFLRVGGIESKNWDTTVFDKMVIKNVVELEIKTIIQLNEQSSKSVTEHPNAFYDKQKQTLYYKEIDYTPFDSIARELAYAFNPDSEASVIAPGIKEVLSAVNPQAANKTLDELGLAPLEIKVPIELPEPGQATLGGSEGNGEELPPPLGGTGTGQGGFECGTTIAGVGKGTSGGGGTPLLGKKHQQKYETYVYVHQDEKRIFDSDHDRRPLIDRKGMEAVKRFELSAKRRVYDANEVTRNNPGYDLYSTDLTGEKTLRYIEVKSTSEPLGDRGVALSLPQFEMALKMGERYWLYIVENVLTEPNIICIQNPAKKTNHLVYDSGWRNLAEQEKTITPASIHNIHRNETS